MQFSNKEIKTLYRLKFNVPVVFFTLCGKWVKNAINMSYCFESATASQSVIRFRTD